VKLLFIICVLFCVSVCINAQVVDTSNAVNTVTGEKKETIDIYKNLLDSNIFLNTKAQAQSFTVSLKKKENTQPYFYLFVSLLFCLGILRTVFSRYFSTLFRVFFNTSLRQNQLTDQLEQATLPSLLFNVFFVFSAGMYIYFLRRHFNENTSNINWYFLGICFAAIAISYFVKYLSLLFTGWVTGYRDEVKTYIFIVFLLNKIIGVLLLPFILVIAFSTYKIAEYAVFISYLIVFVLMLTRFFKAYGILQNKLNIKLFHFLIYILAVEILPLAVIYKSILQFFGKII
jgi:hypothetical protein